MRKCGWLYGQVLAAGEVSMLIREHIAQLVGQALGIAYPDIDVGVWRVGAPQYWSW
ncbi:hypothetical protein [Prevotella sp. P5-92]|uniref:hypothetical protein n=1 Tax=Prevotella sp. P5-92 TaxID=2024222 RepID=UPI00156DDADE|nr:hypothetical protein [Prevotella sp. P5-92]